MAQRHFLSTLYDELFETQGPVPEVGLEPTRFKGG